MTLPWNHGAEPEPGIYYNVSHAEYLTQPGLSVSKLKLFDHCPWQARFGENTDSTDAQRLGTLIHQMLLEPEAFDDRYYATGAQRRGTAEWTNAEARAMGRELIKNADLAAARQMIKALNAQRVVQRMIQPGVHMRTEVSMWWRDWETGLLCKGRMDALRLDIGYAVDLKSCDDASRLGWRRSMEKFAYDLQAIHYSDGFAAVPGGWKLDNFVFLAVEKNAPYKANAWYLDPEQEDMARRKLRSLIHGWAECERTGVWPGYEDFEQPITLSTWRYM